MISDVVEQPANAPARAAVISLVVAIVVGAVPFGVAVVAFAIEVSGPVTNWTWPILLVVGLVSPFVLGGLVAWRREPQARLVGFQNGFWAGVCVLVVLFVPSVFILVSDAL